MESTPGSHLKSAEGRGIRLIPLLANSLEPSSASRRREYSLEFFTALTGHIVPPCDLASDSKAALCSCANAGCDVHPGLGQQSFCISMLLYAGFELRSLPYDDLAFAYLAPASQGNMRRELCQCFPLRDSEEMTLSRLGCSYSIRRSTAHL